VEQDFQDRFSAESAGRCRVINVDLGLDDKVALVAGGTGGVGLAIAKELVREGATVCIGDRDPDRLERARGEVNAGTHVVDVRDGAAVATWIRRVAAERGGPHIVIADGGGPARGEAGVFELDGYRAAQELNLLSQIGLMQAALPYLRQAGWGRIILVGRESPRGQENALTDVARPGLGGYARNLVRELGPGEITVNVIAPGRATADQIAALAAFLCGTRAGSLSGAVHQLTPYEKKPRPPAQTSAMLGGC
jgi:3-oxoacyl-[acyl-carrier protein] reductase